MKNKTILTFSLSAIVVFLLVVISIAVGSFSLDLGEIVTLLTGAQSDTMEARVFFTLRLPRTFMALFTGLALGISGAVYQTIFKNPLASPDITGVASGASLGAGVAIVSQVNASLWIILSSFVGGVLSLVALFFLTYLTGIRKTSNFLFAGIVIKCLADAGLMILKTMADPQSELAAIEFWMMGTVANVTAEKFTLPAIGIGLCLVVLLCAYTQITLLNLGDANATAVGLNPTVWRVILLCVTTLMISCAVSVVGSVAFVGLIAPHISLRLTQKRGFCYLFVSMVVGGCITLIADIAVRLISGGAELPLSIPIVIISVPILAFLIFKSRGVQYE